MKLDVILEKTPIISKFFFGGLGFYLGMEINDNVEFLSNSPTYAINVQVYAALTYFWSKVGVEVGELTLNSIKYLQRN